MNNKLSIIHVAWNGQWAGTLRDIIKSQLNDKDLDVRVVFGSNLSGVYAQEIIKMGVSVYCLNMKRKYGLISNFIGGLRFRRYAKKNRAQIIYYQEAIIPFVLVLPKIFNQKVKVLLHNHGEFVPVYRSVRHKVFSFLKMYLYGIITRYFVDIVIVNSLFTFKHSIAFRVPAKKIKLLYNAVDTKYLAEVSKAKHHLRDRLLNELGIDNSSVVLGNVSRLVPQKRNELLIRAFACLPQKNKKLIFVGEGNDKKRLEALSEELNIKNLIYFLGYRKDAKEIIASLDAVVFPSKGESFGLTALESIILKTPVFVMKDGGGLTEFVKDGVNGYVCSNYGALEKKLSRFFNGEISLEFNSELYKRIVHRSDNEIYAKKIKSFYFDLLKKQESHAS